MPFVAYNSDKCRTLSTLFWACEDGRIFPRAQVECWPAWIRYISALRLFLAGERAVFQRRESMDKFARIAVAIVTMTLGMFVIGEPSWAVDPVNVAGTWNIAVESPNGTGTPTVVFKQEGETLTGTYKGRFGDSSVKGTIKGNDIK